MQVVVSESKLWSLSCLNIAAESSFQFQIQGFRSIVSRCVFHRAWDVSALSASASCKCSASAAFQEACNRGIPSSNLQPPRLDFLQLLLQLWYLHMQRVKLDQTSFLAFIHEGTMSRMKTASLPEMLLFAGAQSGFDSLWKRGS